MFAVVACIAVIALIGAAWQIDRRRHLRTWLPAYLAKRQRVSVPEHVMFAFVDHFEPNDRRRTDEENRRIMAEWVRRYPAMADNHADSDGVTPQHSWFYPAEDYHPHFLDELGKLTDGHYGEVELHLHHGNDTEETLRNQLEKGKADFRKHGFLVLPDGTTAFAFIHGNSALNNSMQDASLCGVNDELRLLHEAGCFADFSYPTYPEVSQTRKINSIYYATSSAQYPKGHDTGEDVRVGGSASGQMLLVQGPLGLNWSRRKAGVMPRIENSEISWQNPGTGDRVRLWQRANIRVAGRPEWLFIKVHCHGAQPEDCDALLGKQADQLFTALESAFKTSTTSLHYVTAREMYNIIKAAEAGRGGDPGKYRDFVVPKYARSSQPVASRAKKRTTA